MRVYAIYWLVDGVSALLVYLPTFMMYQSQLGGVSPYPYLLVITGFLFIALTLWLSASCLSSRVTKGHNTELSFTALSKEDLYCFAFVFLGISFALSSINSTLQTGYQFFTLDYPQPNDNPQKGRYLWPFLGHALTLVAGFACVFGAMKWTRKLIHLDNKRMDSKDISPVN